jgi:hypothetical protein
VLNCPKPAPAQDEIERLMKYEEANHGHCNDYHYLNSLDQCDEEMNHNIYEENDLINLKDDDELSYRNTNIFNFDEYFTV